MSRKISDLLVVSDMDGTLLTRDQRLLRCNLETISLFVGMGGRFAIASGRVIGSIGRYGELVPYLSPCITSGGCVIYDFAEREAVSSALLPRAVARRSVADVLREFPHVGACVMAADGKTYVLNASEALFGLFCDETLVHLLRPFDELPADWNKVLYAGPHETMLQVEEFVKRRSYPGVAFVHTSDDYFEMFPQGVNKGSALVELCRLMDQPLEDTIVIGDYLNDLPMMEAAGHSVAMSNAPIEVRLAADEVTGSNEEGGVGQYLYRLIREFEA